MTEREEPMVQAGGKRSALKWIGCGCGIAVLLVVLVIGSCVFVVMRGKGTVDPAADAFFDAYNREDFDGLYAQFSPEGQAAQSKEEWTTFFQGLRARTGRYVERTATNVNVQANESGQTIAVTYTTKFEKGTTPVDVTFQKVGEDWKVLRVELDLEAFAPEPEGGASVV